MATTDTIDPFATLRATRPGFIVDAGDAGWDGARGSFNLRLDQRPSCVARPRDAGEVAAVMRAAASAGLRVAAQATGHGAAALGDLGGSVLMRTDGLADLRIDAAARRARVGAGVRWGEVSDAAGVHGLVGLAGSARDVGVVGYALNGGLSFLARSRGLACNGILAAELVTAAGEVLHVDAGNRPDILWALRGGGGSFGIVTWLDIALHPLAEVYAGLLFYPIERAAEVLRTWRDLTDTAPDDLATIARIMRIPDMPDVPPPLAGRGFAVIDVVHAGDEATGAALIEPLRALGPEIDGVTTMPASDLGRIHLDPEDPLPYVGDGSLIGPLDAGAIDALVAVAGPDADTSLVMVELRHLGGALAGPADGALSRLRGSFVSNCLGIAPTPQAATAAGHDIARVNDVLLPHVVGRFPNFSEHDHDPAETFPAEVVARLRALRDELDPDGVLHANHGLAPA